VESGSIELEPEDNALEAYHSLAVESGTSRYVRNVDSVDTSELSKKEGARKYVKG